MRSHSKIFRQIFATSLVAFFMVHGQQACVPKKAPAESSDVESIELGKVFGSFIKFLRGEPLPNGKNAQNIVTEAAARVETASHNGVRVSKAQTDDLAALVENPEDTKILGNLLEPAKTDSKLQKEIDTILDAA